MAKKETGPIGRMGTESNGTVSYASKPAITVDFSGMTNGVSHMREVIMRTKLNPISTMNSNMESLRGSKVSQ